ncbi:hypothetical protein GW17_00043741 [Ensete ventricosum]|nr:hypothetical protein GW17_00043741 [Ensete ventricosum]
MKVLRPHPYHSRRRWNQKQEVAKTPTAPARTHSRASSDLQSNRRKPVGSGFRRPRRRSSWSSSQTYNCPRSRSRQRICPIRTQDSLIRRRRRRTFPGGGSRSPEPGCPGSGPWGIEAEDRDRGGGGRGLRRRRSGGRRPTMGEEGGRELRKEKYWEGYGTQPR